MASGRLVVVLVKDMVRDLVRHRGQHVMAVLTLAAGLVLAGGGLLAVETLDRWVSRMEVQARITVFAVEGASLEATAQSLQNDARVKSVRRVSSQEATRRFLELSREAGLMLEGLGGEAVPENLELELRGAFTSSARAMDVAESLRGLPGVGEVVADHERLQAFQQGAKALRLALSGFGVLLLVVAGFSTGNVIRMAILARQEEIIIMRLVGATEGFIRTPLVLLGAGLGLGASVLALVGLWGLWLPLQRGAFSMPPILVELARLGFFSGRGMALLALLGALTGGLGALWGFRATRHLGPEEVESTHPEGA